MGRFAKYLRARSGKGGGVNNVTDKGSKAKFAREIEEMLDPERQAEAGLKMHEEMVLKSFREPTVKEVLEELSRQCKRLRERHPKRPLMVACGAYAFALLAQVRSYPEHTMGLEIKMDKHVPPWDTVVMYRDGRGKRNGGVL